MLTAVSAYSTQNIAQQTQNIFIKFVQCWTDVENAVKIVYKCFVFAGWSDGGPYETLKQ